MRTQTGRKPFRDEALFIAILMMVVIALPLAAFLAFTLRLVFLAGVLVAAVVSVAVVFSPSLRAGLKSWADGQVSYNGVRLAHDVAIHPTHSWMRLEDGEMVVGADDLTQVALGPVEEVELPRPGTEVARGDTLFRLRHADRTVGVHSPVTGSVIGGNRRLASEPGLVNQAPFTRGWAVRLKGDAPRRQRRSLLRGKRARAWLREEVDRLLSALLGLPGGVPTLPDGGVLVDELHRHIDEATWHQLAAEMFQNEAPAHEASTHDNTSESR